MHFNHLNDCYSYRFSVNFTLECCPNPLNIAYHFKTNFMNNTVTHNYKTVGDWNEEIVDENTWIQGPGKIHAFIFLSFVSLQIIHKFSHKNERTRLPKKHCLTITFIALKQKSLDNRLPLKILEAHAILF